MRRDRVAFALDQDVDGHGGCDVRCGRYYSTRHPMTAETRLGRHYSDQFGDLSIVDAYEHRPPYPARVFSLLHDLVTTAPRVVLDLGCGTGDVARPLAPLVDAVDAIDRAPHMIARAARLPGGDRPNLRWITGRVEEVEFPHSQYGLVTAGESLHWMDWESLFPRLRAVTAPESYVAIVGRHYPDSGWSDELTPILQHYNTNREYESYNLIDELTKRDLFHVAGEDRSEPAVFTQSIEHFIESIHSQAGYSRERMSPADASAFDAEVEQILLAHSTGRVLEFHVVGQVVWGRLTAGQRSLSDGEQSRVDLLPMGFYGSSRPIPTVRRAPSSSSGSRDADTPS